jgi:hypothetical protein
LLPPIIDVFIDYQWFVQAIPEDYCLILAHFCPLFAHAPVLSDFILYFDDINDDSLHEGSES